MKFTEPESFALPASLFTGLVLLTGLMLGDPKPGDPLLVDPKQAINHYEVKRRESWGIKEGRPMLQIPDGLREDKEWLTLHLSGASGLSRGAIEEGESLLEFFVLVEKYAWTNPEDDEDFTEIMQLLVKKIAIAKTLENYLEWTLFYKRRNITSILFVMLIFLALVVLMEAFKSWCSNEGRLVMLQILDGLSQQTMYLRSGDSQVLIAAIKKYKSLLQLFVLMEKYTLIGPGDLDYFTNIMQVIENIAIFKVEWNYRESQQSSTITNEGHMIEPAQTAAVIPYPSTVAELMPDLPKYKMDRLPRGLCIIFNAENFTIKTLRKRDGTEKDVEALLNTFQNRLKFETRVVQDPTKKKYVECLQNIGRMDHSKFDCFVCVILSHGSNGHVCGTDGGTVSIDALTGLFRGDYVPSLVNKPKLFFIQACQGAYPQESIDIQQDDTASLPFKSDTLVSHATIPGHASFRNVNQGSLFIISLCKIINIYYKKKVDLLSMLTMVNDLMSREAIEGKWMEIGKQIGNPSHCLRKQIFFNEGLEE